MTDFNQTNLEPIKKLNKDIIKASIVLSKQEVRYLVDMYYAIQKDRIATGNRVYQMTITEEPHSVLEWILRTNLDMENIVKLALDYYSQSTPMGQYARSIAGIGPIIAAGLEAYIDIEQAPTVGHIWRIAGLDPTVEWLSRAAAKEVVEQVMGKARVATALHFKAFSDVLHRDIHRLFLKYVDWKRRLEEEKRKAKAEEATTADEDEGFEDIDDGEMDAGDDDNADGNGKVKPAKEIKPTQDLLARIICRRPWNANLKTLTWKIGESFVKCSAREDDIYGKFYLERKKYEQENNEGGKYADQATEKLRRFNIGKGTAAYKWYSQGMLPPGHIHARAKRWTVKLFLAHWHQECFRVTFGKEPPLPYPIAVLGHVHYIPRPEREMKVAVQAPRADTPEERTMGGNR